MKQRYVIDVRGPLAIVIYDLKRTYTLPQGDRLLSASRFCETDVKSMLTKLGYEKETTDGTTKA